MEIKALNMNANILKADQIWVLKSTQKSNTVPTQDDTSSSFFDPLPGVEDVDSEKPKDDIKKYLDLDDPLEAFCKAKGINYKLSTPREIHNGQGSTDRGCQSQTVTDG